MFDGEGCGVGLGRPAFVKEFVVCAAFGILLRSDDGSVLFGRDRSHTLSSAFGPCAFCQDGPREPTEIDCQVVKSAKIMCDTVAVGVNDYKKVGSGGLDERFTSDRI